MNLLKELDASIVQCELMRAMYYGGSLASGYVPEGSTTQYHHYMNNASWEALKAGMSEEHRQQFGAGNGGEMEEKDGKPPKMAAFASSSRMLYLLSRDIPGFCFECKLPTTVGGTANMDGYLERETEHVFVEAKCRELYGHKAQQIIKQAYKPVYGWLREKMPGIFSCVMEDREDSNMLVVFFCQGKPVVYFDIKQMICHLLGIATMLLKKPDNKDILFLYLLHNPERLSLKEETGLEVMRIWGDTCWAATHHHFKEMFGHIVDYLVREKGLQADQQTVEHLKHGFKFSICSQVTYRGFFEKEWGDVLPWIVQKKKGE